MSRLRLQHFQNYQDMPSAQIKDFYLNSEIDVDVPVEKGWRRSGFAPASLAHVWCLCLEASCRRREGRD